MVSLWKQVHFEFQRDGSAGHRVLHSLLNFEFLNPRRSKIFQYIELKFLDTVDRAMPFQYSEFPSETVSLMGQIL